MRTLGVFARVLFAVAVYPEPQTMKLVYPHSPTDPGISVESKAPAKQKLTP